MGQSIFRIDGHLLPLPDPGSLRSHGPGHGSIDVVGEAIGDNSIRFAEVMPDCFAPTMLPAAVKNESVQIGSNGRVPDAVGAVVLG